MNERAFRKKQKSFGLPKLNDSSVLRKSLNLSTRGSQIIPIEHSFSSSPKNPYNVSYLTPAVNKSKNSSENLSNSILPPSTYLNASPLNAPSSANLQISQQSASKDKEMIDRDQITPKSKLREKLKRVQVIKIIEGCSRDNVKITPSKERLEFIEMILTPSQNTTYLREKNNTFDILPLSQIHWQQLSSKDQNGILFLSLFDMNSLSDITFEVAFPSKLANQISQDLLRRVREWIIEKQAPLTLCTLYSAPHHQQLYQQQQQQRQSASTKSILSEEPNFQVFFHKLLTPIDIRSIGGIAPWIMDIIKKFYLKIMETAKKLLPQKMEWLGSQTIFKKRVYLEDSCEESWVINLENLFQQDFKSQDFLSKLSQQFTEPGEKQSWDKYEKLSQLHQGMKHNKLEEAVQQRRKRDNIIQQIKQDSNQQRKPTAKMIGEIYLHEKIQRQKSLSNHHASELSKQPTKRALSFFPNLNEPYIQSDISENRPKIYLAQQSLLSGQAVQLLQRNKNIQKRSHSFIS